MHTRAPGSTQASGRFRSVRRPPRARLGALAATALILIAARADAYDITTSPYLLGDWYGLRTHLAERGITFNLAYGGQAGHNFSGGTERLTRYTDQWVFAATLDLDRLWGWKGATFQATMTDRNGRNLGADANIGNSMLIQEVYGRGQTWHLTQLWLEQRLLDDRLQIKLGRLTVGEDFAAFSCDFQNLTFCGAQPGNLVGSYWVNWPTSLWATRVKYQAASRSYVQIGAYQVNPNYVDDGYARRHGWQPDFPDGTTGVLLPLEVGWLPTLAGRPGSYKIGVWYNTSPGSDLYYDVNHAARGVTGLPPLERSGQYGVYLSIQQQITGMPEGSGAVIFLHVTQADRDTAVLDRQISLGVVYRGPFARARNMIALGLGATDNNSRHADFVRQSNARTGQRVVAGDGYEYVAEMFYSWSPVPSMYFRPNLQYIVRPGGTPRNPNAFVLGLKSGVTF